MNESTSEEDTVIDAGKRQLRDTATLQPEDMPSGSVRLDASTMDDTREGEGEPSERRPALADAIATMYERGESVRAVETTSAFNRLEARGKLNEATARELETLATRLTVTVLEPAVERIIQTGMNEDQETVETLVRLFDPVKTHPGDCGSEEAAHSSTALDASSDSETGA